MRTKQTWFRKKYRHQDICIHRICIYRIYKISGYASSKLSTDTTAVSKTDFFSVKPVGGQSNGTNKTKNKLYKVHMTNETLLKCSCRSTSSWTFESPSPSSGPFEELSPPYMKVITLVHIGLLTENKRFLSHLLQHN